jgi:hypothetical protein
MGLAAATTARWNVRYVKNQSQRSNDHVTQVLKMDFAEAVSMADHCKYKCARGGQRAAGGGVGYAGGGSAQLSSGLG